MANRKTSWRAWAIVCEGIGPINGRVYMSMTGARIAKRLNYPENDLYQVKRVRLTLDPENKRRGMGKEVKP